MGVTTRPLMTHAPLNKSSVWDSRAPVSRHLRQLSHSRVGLGGESPQWVGIRGFSPSPERKHRARVEEAVKGKDVLQLWKLYMDLEDMPLSNRELSKVARRLFKLLIDQLKVALDGDDPEELKRAVEVADGKLQIIELGGISELKEAKRRLNWDPESVPHPDCIAGLMFADKASTRAGTSSLGTTGGTAAIGAEASVPPGEGGSEHSLGEEAEEEFALEEVEEEEVWDAEGDEEEAAEGEEADEEEECF